MNARNLNNPKTPGKPQSGQVRIIVPAIAFFLAGVIITAAWFHRGAAGPTVAVSPDTELSQTTRTVLAHLNSPVEIRFYSVLDPASVPSSVQDFSSRVDQLLDKYKSAAGDHLKLVRCTVSSTTASTAALADGISAFNNDKGDACFLGIAVVCGPQKESLPRLVPDWEQALEADLTRAIAQAATPPVTAQAVAHTDRSTFDAVRRALPNIDTVSVEEGSAILHDNASAQIQQAAEDLRTAMDKAEQQFVNAQSPAAQQAARDQLRKVQAIGKARLEQIALDAHAQIVALQQIKNASP
jgi:hypothetical protein